MSKCIVLNGEAEQGATRRSGDQCLYIIARCCRQLWREDRVWWMSKLYREDQSIELSPKAVHRRRKQL
ncbi:hypothetical protein ECG_03705 [Echinococcus granulosus]|nr:hypothetical protein ECG_03705 [Echinococcus granulosus]